LAAISSVLCYSQIHQSMLPRVGTSQNASIVNPCRGAQSPREHTDTLNARHDSLSAAIIALCIYFLNLLRDRKGPLWNKMRTETLAYHWLLGILHFV